MKKSKKIIFLSLVQIDSLNERGIYHDLLREFVSNGHKVSVVCPLERRINLATRLINESGILILQVWSLNIQKSPIWEKGLATLLLNFFMQRAVKKYFADDEFDLILYATPPITLTGVIKWLKKNKNAKTYLLLKDIFPQNAVDMGMFGNKSPIYHFFKKKELALYQLSDRIGCMSPANVDYLINEHPNLKDKTEVNPNSIDLTRISSQTINRKDVLSKWNIPSEAVIFLYGGNLGKPQGASFLLEIIQSGDLYPEAFFLIIGDGTDYKNLASWFQEFQPSNAKLIQRLPKVEFDELAACSDVGLILLRKEFTIPNFPSRILSYMENKLAILAITDSSTDIGRIATEKSFGRWSLYGDLEEVKMYIAKFISNAEERKSMGHAGFKFMHLSYDVRDSYKKIIDFVS